MMIRCGRERMNVTLPMKTSRPSLDSACLRSASGPRSAKLVDPVPPAAAHHEG